jgi:hypothetical protein
VKLQYDLFTILDLLVEGILDPEPELAKGLLRIEAAARKELTLDRRTALVCADGFTVSVQMGRFNYCSPRESCLASREYDSAELGYPSAADDLITQYAEDLDCLTGTVYGRVPMETIQELFQKHGGLHPAELIRLTKIQKQLENR